MDFRTSINFNQSSCRFESKEVNLSEKMEVPLSVILQITRQCDLSCVFCSETEKMPDPSYEQLQKMKNNLAGVARIYLSGGEPLLRKDLPEILDLFYGNFIIGLPTNAIKITSDLAKILKDKIDFANVGLDGPRNVTTRLRGSYDRILRGIDVLKNFNIPISLSCVVLSSTTDSILLTCQIADLLDAKKLKLILPIKKGNALDLPDVEYLKIKESEMLFERVTIAKEKYGWRPTITLTTWGLEVEGYSLLVYPDGNAYAWPVYDQKDKILLLGNLISEPIKDIWARNPFKENHYKKYLGRSILVV